MTEKRFTLVDDEFVSRIKNNGVSMTAREIVDCLNALHEENKELKQQNEFLKKQLDRVCIDNETMGDKLKKIGRIL